MQPPPAPLPITPAQPVKPVTLKHLAERLGLSHGSVSKALRNSREIPARTRARVQEAAREMRYEPNPMGVGLACFKRSSTVHPLQAALAWLNFWPRPEALLQQAGFDLYWRGAVRCAEKYGYRVEEFAVNDRMPLPRVERILRARGIQGILLPPLPPACGIPKLFDPRHFSLVRLSHTVRDLEVQMVGPDQVANAMLAFDEMRRRGYGRIGFVGGPPSKDRLFGAGYLWAQVQAHAQAARPRPIPPLFLGAEPARADSRRLAAWLKAHRPDAILRDSHSVPGLLRQQKIRIPDDLGLATLNVHGLAGEAGIDQNFEEIGRVGVMAVISLLHDNDRGVPLLPRSTLIKGKWIDGPTLPDRTALPA